MVSQKLRPVSQESRYAISEIDTRISKTMTPLSEIKTLVSRTETRASESKTGISKTDTRSSKTETRVSERDTAFSGNTDLFRRVSASIQAKPGQTGWSGAVSAPLGMKVKITSNPHPKMKKTAPTYPRGGKKEK